MTVLVTRLPIAQHIRNVMKECSITLIIEQTLFFRNSNTDLKNLRIWRVFPRGNAPCTREFQLFVHVSENRCAKAVEFRAPTAFYCS